MIITVEGNIGAGKSTLLENITRHLDQQENSDIKVLFEPIDLFKAFFGNTDINPLQEFYNDERNAFAFQNYVLDLYKSRLATQFVPIYSQRVVLMERGLDACSVFAEANIENMTRFENLYLKEKYKDIRDLFFRKQELATDGVIMIDVNIPELKHRIKKRNRAEELDVDENYLMKVQAEYDKYAAVVKDKKVPLLRAHEVSVDQALEFIASVVSHKVKAC